MNEFGLKAKNASLAELGLTNATSYWNLSPKDLEQKTIDLGEGVLADNGALVVDTGLFKGRSPKDKFIVCDANTINTVWWGDVNHKFEPEKFENLYEKVIAHLAKQEIYVRDAYVCADPKHRMKIRVVTESPWQNIFAYNLFLRPTNEEILKEEKTEWHIISVPSFKADPVADGTRQENFTIINFTKKIILIGGSAYTGEIKKGMFSVLNYLLPKEHEVLAMHCSANIGKNGDTAIFFGLSGTGKTTLSADPERMLIGDDEHGWSEKSVFNFEGGCYAKCVHLSKEKEPQIWNAIKSGALVENTIFFKGTNTIDFSNISKTENTRVAYPINFIDNIAEPSVGEIPKNIFFLTCDAFGILPPISKLDPAQAMYHFISGYTAKVAGTETDITEPVLTFSPCFGKAFLPLHPARYAELLGEKLKENPNINVWLVNTGWSGGSYGVGKRMSLSFTRAMIKGALNGDLDKMEYENLPIFNLKFPKQCPGVPADILNPRNTWSDKEAYDLKLKQLASAFIENFKVYADGANHEILDASPKIT